MANLQERLDEVTKELERVIGQIDMHQAEANRLTGLGQQLQGRQHLLQELLNEEKNPQTPAA